MISDKRRKFINEYLIDFDGSKAAIRAGYAPKHARSTAYKILQSPEVREELEKQYDKARVSDSELISRIDAMTKGDLPTKIVKGTHEREEYDALGAAEKLARIKSLFQDRVDLNITHLNITDEEE